jgi:aryl-alcohol dehydrogenase-like predicted oxidoreductase
MLYAPLGASGLIVSRLALGCLTFGAKGGEASILYKVDQTEATRIVARALEAGINFFDTSDFYADGTSEEFLGAALKGRRHEAVISSKVGFRVGPNLTDAGLSRRHILESVDGSLRRLGTDYLDVYIAHKEDPLTPLDETLAAFDEIVRAGKVRYTGFSNWRAWHAATAVARQRALGYAPFVTGQILYSLVQRDAEYELLPFMAAAGIGGMAWSPLAGGFLSGKYDRTNIDAPGSRVAMSSVPFDREQGLALVDVLREIAAARGCTVGQLAVAWVLRRQEIATAVIGVSRFEQLEEALGATGIALSDEEAARIEAAVPMRPLYPHWHIDVSQDEQAFVALGREKPPLVGGAGRQKVTNKA